MEKVKMKVSGEKKKQCRKMTRKYRCEGLRIMRNKSWKETVSMQNKSNWKNKGEKKCKKALIKENHFYLMLSLHLTTWVSAASFTQYNFKHFVANIILLSVSWRQYQFPDLGQSRFDTFT